ncbi:CTD nuclear envelope phosphatase 1 [Toxocara canis]|uniref:CTD nuclear envelope phosphatase 1 n=1 Tax=Toxocara canis TaxID=6265 RepID=A0A0B2VQP8_TOXCA|nr:CTD nuclear envelope phosphatase 1 [Toxocara canis]
MGFRSPGVEEGEIKNLLFRLREGLEAFCLRERRNEEGGGKKRVAGVVRRKILVLDLDETLIHSHHDGVIRPMVKPGTPPDFILRMKQYLSKCSLKTDVIFDLVFMRPQEASLQVLWNEKAERVGDGTERSRARH